ncbi:MAG: pyridoxal kinase PdxY [Beijerinckiaceae bacterium]
MARQLTVLSIQSHVAYGHVGNSSAVFPMQRLGCEVWPVNTVQFSNHPGYGGMRGQVFEGWMIRDVVQGIADRGVLNQCDGVLSGYLGAPEIGEAIKDAAELVKAANPQALWCCDPVIGDVGSGVFVKPGVPEFFRDKALKSADIITPNQFELNFLADRPTGTAAEARAALDKVHALGPSVILVTSLITSDTPDDAMDMVASDRTGLYRLRSPRLGRSFNGAGDAVAALFFVHYLRTRSSAEALAAAGSSVYGLLKATAEAGSREILTVAAQEEFVNPSVQLEAERLR